MIFDSSSRGSVVARQDRRMPLALNALKEPSNFREIIGVGAQAQEAAIHTKQRLSMPTNPLHGRDVRGRFFHRKERDTKAVVTSHKGKPYGTPTAKSGRSIKTPRRKRGKGSVIAIANNFLRYTGPDSDSGNRAHAPLCHLCASYNFSIDLSYANASHMA